MTTQLEQTNSNAISKIINDRPIRLIGFTILAATIGIFGVWGYVAPIDGAAFAPGFVVVKSHRKTIQHLDGGIVSEIRVKNGDLVKEGDVLLVLDGTEDKSQLEMFRGRQIALSATVARLEAERDHKPRVVYPATLNNLSDTRIVEAKQAEDQLFMSRKISHEGEISVLNQRIGQLSSRIDGLKGQRSSKQVLMNSYGEEVRDLKELLAEGFADKQRLRDVERNYAHNNGEIAGLSSEIASSELQITETKLQILQLQKKFQEDVAGKLTEAQTELYDINQRIVAMTDKVTRVEIKAPVKGRILGMETHTIGGVIRPGEPILDIVPEQEQLVIDAQVSPIDIDRVHTGLVAEVRFTAFKQAVTPVTEGKVITLSADKMIEERTGTPYFQATIELTPESIAKLGSLELVPGMPAETLIKTGERTLFEYLTQPITNAFARAFRED